MTMVLLQSTTECRSAEHPSGQPGSGASIVLLPASSSPVVGRGAGPHATKITHPQVRSLIAADGRLVHRAAAMTFSGFDGVMHELFDDTVAN